MLIKASGSRSVGCHVSSGNALLNHTACSPVPLAISSTRAHGGGNRAAPAGSAHDCARRRARFWRLAPSEGRRRSKQHEDGAASDTELLSHSRRTQISRQTLDLRRVDRSWAALVFPLFLSLRDALPLPLQHDFPLPGRHASQDRQHQLRGRVASIQAFAADAQDHQTDAALGQVRLDRQQLGRRPRKTIGLGDHQHVAFTQEG